MNNYIIGSGGHCRSVIKILLQKFSKQELKIIDLFNENLEESIMGIKTSDIKDLNLLNNKKNTNIYCAIGDNSIRGKYLQLARSLGFKTPCIVSKKASIDSSAKIHQGTFIGDLAYIGPKVVLGQDCIVNTGSIIEHETIIKDRCQISPNATICGRCIINENSFIGASATIIDKIQIATFTKIGAGATVIKSIHVGNLTWVGNPVKQI